MHDGVAKHTQGHAIGEAGAFDDDVVILAKAGIQKTFEADRRCVAFKRPFLGTDPSYQM